MPPMDTSAPKEIKKARTPKTAKCQFCEKELELQRLFLISFTSGNIWLCKPCYDSNLTFEPHKVLITPALEEEHIPTPRQRRKLSVTESEKTPPPPTSSIQASDNDSLWSPVVCDDPHVEAVVKRLRDRSRAGKIKYGVGLDRKDLTTLEWMQHLQEELMDAANYLERLMHDYKQASAIFDALNKLPRNPTH